MKIEKNISLAQYTTLGVGGLADFFVRVRSKEEVLAALQFAKETPPNPPLSGGENGLPIFILGGGSNLLFADEGFRGLVIKSEVNHVQFEDDKVLVGSGVGLGALIQKTVQQKLAGLEKLMGIPGTVGGAVVDNANEIGTHVRSVEVITPAGELKTLQQADLKFEYRNSALKYNNNFLLEIEFQLEPTEQNLEQVIRAAAQGKNKKHPAKGTAGSWFKNPNERKAWELIDGAGCRGLQVGQAIVSEVHANFFQNLGGAKASDFLELEKIVKQKVFDKFGIELEREVVVVGEKGVLS